MAERVDLVESQRLADYAAFTNLLKIEQEKNKIQSEIILHQESISNTYLQENTHLKKKVNVLTWKNVGLALLAIIEAIIIIIS